MCHPRWDEDYHDDYSPAVLVRRQQKTPHLRGYGEDGLVHPRRYREAQKNQTLSPIRVPCYVRADERFELTVFVS